MAGKYGGQSVLFLVDGYNLISNKLKGLRVKKAALQEDTTGLGDSAEETTPTGMTTFEITQEGAFFDTDLNRIHTAMAEAPSSDPQAAARVSCVGFAGQTVGEGFFGCQGYSESYEVLAQLGNLTKANVIHRVSGGLNTGLILQDLEAQPGDWTGTTVDGVASSTNGGVGYLQVTQSFGSFTGVIQHSDDAAAWSTLITFAAVTAAPAALRTTVAGSVKRYLRFVGTVWGNVSPSASISQSASLSPSPSVSPSASESTTLSASLSASASASPTKSASASISPSSSLSPSVSASASVSPSTAAGSAGSATVFCGFARF